MRRGYLLRQEGPDKNGYCVPNCVWFRCGHRPPVLQIRGNTYWCAWLNDECIGPRCQYAICVRAKMLPDNRCGLVVRRVTRDRLTPEDFKLNVRLPSRVTKRLGIDEDLV